MIAYPTKPEESVKRLIYFEELLLEKVTQQQKYSNTKLNVNHK